MATRLVNPTPTQIRDLPVGATFFVEGVLSSMDKRTREEQLRPGARSATPREVMSIGITTAEGRIVSVEGTSFPLRYQGGVLENLHGAAAEIGEKVSVQVTIVVEDGAKTTSVAHEQAELLTPSSARLREYIALRRQVQARLSDLSEAALTGRYTVARYIFAALRKLAMTGLEREALEKSLKMMPVMERPVYRPNRPSFLDELEAVFGVNIEELSPLQFLAFARKVLHGEIPNPEKPDRQTCLFRYLDLPPFTTEQFVELAFSTLQVRIRRLEQTNDSYKEYWEDHYVAEECLRHLGMIQDPAVFSVLAWMIDYCLERDYFDNRFSGSEERTCPGKFDSLLKLAVESLHYNACYKQGKLPAGFDTGRLLVWRNVLSAYPYMGATADKIRAAIIPLTTIS